MFLCFLGNFQFETLVVVAVMKLDLSLQYDMW